MDFMQYSHIDILETDTGYAKAKVNIEPYHLNYFGYVHGGLYYTMADSIAGAVTHRYEGDYVTLDGNIHYMKAVQKGTITGVGKTLQKTRKTVVVEVDLFDEHERHLVRAIFTMYRVK